MIVIINFSLAYKKAFKQILAPYGYNIWKNFFYKDLNNELLFFVKLKKVYQSRISSIIEMCIGFLPYCMDLGESKFEILNDDYGFDLATILRKLMPERLTQEFLWDRINATNDEAIIKSINLICDDMENIILPYFHKFIDLEFLYNECLCFFPANHENNEYIYALSLKLHKYEKALLYADARIRSFNNSIKETNTLKDKYQRGELDEHELKVLKKRPNFIKEMIMTYERMITESENNLKKFSIIKKALLENNYNYLDKIVEKTEADSRKYIKIMFRG